MKRRNFKLYLIAIAAVMLVAASAEMAITGYVFAYNRNQATGAANDCGNGQTPTNIGCQNTDSQIQGDENSVALTSQQTFPSVTREPPTPPTPPGCPADTVWDITIRGEAREGGVPVGTVICLFEGLFPGNNPALVLLDPPITTDVGTVPQVQEECNAPGTQVAQVTSGNPPNPLTMDSFLCAFVFPV